MRNLHHLDRRVRFLLAGGLAAGVSWLSRFGFGLVMPFPLDVAAATATGMLIGFVLYRSLVFPGSRQSLVSQLSGFLLVNLLGGAVTVMTALIVRDAAAVPLGLGTAAAPASHAVGIAVGAAANYLGHKTITFRVA